MADTLGARTPPFASAWRRAHLTVEERIARGKAARTSAPRLSHGRWEPAPGRPDPIALLEEQADSRVAELVPIRYGRMLVSPFTFYRRAALLMAADLADTPVSGVRVQLCGDAHLSNFGLFGTPERQMIFDINDFDETLPGPWEWDVKRMAASFEILGRDRGFTPDDRRAIVMAGVAEYRDRMRRASGMSALGAWYDQLEVGVLLNLVRKEVRVKRVSKEQERAAQRRVREAYSRDSTRVLARRAADVEGELRIVADPPLIVPIEDLVVPGSEWENADAVIKKLLSSYRRTLGRQHHPLEEFRYVHAARKVVGVGSVGTRCYILLLVGRDAGDPLFLQVKEAQASVLERFAGTSTYSHHGERIVAGQRLMQAATDIFLGWQRIRGSTAWPATTMCGNSMTGRAGRTSTTSACPGQPFTPASAVPPWHARTPAGATGSQSPRTWGRAIRLTGRSRTSVSLTPTRMSETMRPSRPPSAQGGLPLKPASRPG